MLGLFFCERILTIHLAVLYTTGVSWTDVWTELHLSTTCCIHEWMRMKNWWQIGNWRSKKLKDWRVVWKQIDIKRQRVKERTQHLSIYRLTHSCTSAAKWGIPPCLPSQLWSEQSSVTLIQQARNDARACMELLCAHIVLIWKVRRNMRDYSWQSLGQRFALCECFTLYCI